MFTRVLNAIFQLRERKPNSGKELENWQPPLSSLQDSIDIDDFVNAYKTTRTAPGGGGVDFGAKMFGFELDHNEFREFASLVSRGDVLRSFQLSTWGGLALLREGRVIAHWNTVHYQPRELSHT